MHAAILYCSRTGNTEKVAHAIEEGLASADWEVTLLRIEDAQAEEIDFYAYDLICVGFPSYQWSPPKPVDAYLKQKFGEYKRQGRVKTGAPKVTGQRALIFCTYSGPHTGIDEAIPAAKYAGQFFAHLGFTVVDEWYVVGEFHGSEEKSMQGRLGDIRGRPNAEDLHAVRTRAKALATHLISSDSSGT